MPFSLTEPPRIAPEILLAHLEKHFHTLEEILAELQCTPDELLASLEDPRTSQLLRLKARVTATQVKLLATQYAPQAVQKLITLMETSEKPEVARRAAVAILQTSGIATRTATQPVIPITADNAAAQKPGDDQQPPSQAERDLDAAICKVLKFKRIYSIDFNAIPDDDMPRIAHALGELVPACCFDDYFLEMQKKKAADHPTPSSGRSDPPPVPRVPNPL